MAALTITRTHHFSALWPETQALAAVAQELDPDDAGESEGWFNGLADERPYLLFKDSNLDWRVGWLEDRLLLNVADGAVVPIPLKDEPN